MRKVLYTVSSVFGVGGMLLLMGTFVVWLIGLETITSFYENNKALVFCALAGVVLIGLGVLLSTLAGGQALLATAPQATTAPSGPPERGVTCDKCLAINDLGAKFCDQCGTALPGREGDASRGITQRPRSP